MASTHKKVIVRKMNRDSLSGYASPSDLVRQNRLELLDTEGNVMQLDVAEVKSVYFVREFMSGDSLGRKTFHTRPRSEGLWVRLRFRDNDVLEGWMPNDLTLLDQEGVLLTPPDARANAQRVFVPRSALSELKILAVIGGRQPGRRRPEGQESLDFREPESSVSSGV